MDITPIKTDADYRAALAEIEALMNAEPDTPDGDRLDVVATLVEAYEARHFPIAAPDPIAAIKFRMQQMRLSRKRPRALAGYARPSLRGAVRPPPPVARHDPPAQRRAEHPSRAVDQGAERPRTTA